MLVHADEQSSIRSQKPLREADDAEVVDAYRYDREQGIQVERLSYEYVEVYLKCKEEWGCQLTRTKMDVSKSAESRRTHI